MVKILNVGSIQNDDLTPQARIRNAAVEVFGELGFAKATVRSIADRAGVSPGLVIHRFGSKEGLRQACDDWVLEFIGNEKLAALAGPLPKLRDYLAAHPEFAAVSAYILSALRHDGPIADVLFDRMCALTHTVLRAGVAAGSMREPPDLQASAAIMVGYSVGANLFGTHIARQLGGASLWDPQVSERYAAAALDLFTNGVVTDAALAAMVRTGDDQGSTPTPPDSAPSPAAKAVRKATSRRTSKQPAPEEHA